MWRKSSRSMGNGECVEVGTEVGYGPDEVAVRDTKEARPHGNRTVLVFPAAAWRDFTGRLQSD